MMRNISGVTGAMGSFLLTFAGACVADTEMMTAAGWRMIGIMVLIAAGLYFIALYTKLYADWQDAENERLRRNLRKYAERQQYRAC